MGSSSLLVFLSGVRMFLNKGLFEISDQDTMEKLHSHVVILKIGVF